MVTYKMKKLFFLAFVATTLCSSCNPVFYQVYEVKSNALKQTDNSLVYENEDLKVMYNLWSAGGSMNFIVQNKTDRDLFLDMGQSFFIFNGEASDYFQNREYTNTVSMSTSASYGVSLFSATVGYWPNTYLVPGTQSLLAKALKGSSTSVTTKEKEIICIPANSFKTISGQNIFQQYLMTCNKKVDYPNESAVAANYSESSSPAKFRNRISYSFDENGSDLRQIENDFYLSSITNYSTKAATEKVEEKVGCSKIASKKTYYFKIGGPNKYYKSYRKKN